EIVLNLRAARMDAPRFARTYRAMVATLFIHGLLHLKGLAHGRRMDKLEQTLIAHYVSPSVTRHRN
ncbi:MAG: hypothetical protein U1A28_05730, partial [Patescibacteria group bacterium]|nr:hypothetical protein [Patescibacteria group bacterium]